MCDEAMWGLALHGLHVEGYSYHIRSTYIQYSCCNVFLSLLGVTAVTNYVRILQYYVLWPWNST